MSNTKERHWLVDWLLAIGLIIVIISIWYWSWNWVDNHIESKDRGEFGDKFGYINSLFSGLAFAMIVFTIILQKRELSLQRKELEDTRDVFKIQSTTMKLQRFENTFFNLWNNHNSLLNAMNRKVIIAFIQQFDNAISQNRNWQSFNSDQKRGVLLSIATAKLHGGAGYDIHTYLRSITNLLYYVHNSTILKEEEKALYINLVRDQLSVHEIRLLGYIMFYAFKPKLHLKLLVTTYDLLNRYDDPNSRVTKDMIDDEVQVINA